MKLSAQQIIKRQDQLKSLRGVWETHWQELADYIIPRKNQFIKRNVPGEKKGIELYDNTAMVSAESLVAALHGLLTNANTLWFSLQASQEELNDDEQSVEYLQELTRRMHRVLNNSNFQTEIHEFYLDLVAFGTAVMTVEEDNDNLVRFSSKALGESFVEENHMGAIETVYRLFEWNARQIVAEFAKGVNEDEQSLKPLLGDQVTKAFLGGSNEKFEIIHAVYREKETERKDMPFLSQYVIKAEQKQIREGRFRRFPYIVSRWSKVSGEIYGRSPGMTALPEAKTVNVMSKTVIKGAQKVVDPPVQMPDDGFVRPFRTAPASINYYRAGSGDRIEPIFNDTRIDFGFEAVRERQLRIREAFFVDKLNLVQNDRMTTTEVNQRIQEQLRFLGPLLGRQYFEFLRPLVDRVLDIMIKKDGGSGELIGQVPEQIQDIELDVQYSSPIARAQRIQDAEAIQNALAASGPVLQLQPDVIDNVDGDAMIRENFKIFGATQRVLRSSAEIESIRESRAQAQQEAIKQQQQAQEAENVSKVAPVLQE